MQNLFQDIVCLLNVKDRIEKAAVKKQMQQTPKIEAFSYGTTEKGMTYQEYDRLSMISQQYWGNLNYPTYSTPYPQLNETSKDSLATKYYKVSSSNCWVAEKTAYNLLMTPKDDPHNVYKYRLWRDNRLHLTCYIPDYEWVQSKKESLLVLNAGAIYRITPQMSLQDIYQEELYAFKDAGISKDAAKQKVLQDLKESNQAVSRQIPMAVFQKALARQNG